MFTDDVHRKQLVVFKLDQDDHVTYWQWGVHPTVRKNGYQLGKFIFRTPFPELRYVLTQQQLHDWNETQSLLTYVRDRHWFTGDDFHTLLNMFYQYLQETFYGLENNQFTIEHVLDQYTNADALFETNPDFIDSSVWHNDTAKRFLKRIIEKHQVKLSFKPLLGENGGIIFTSGPTSNYGRGALDWRNVGSMTKQEINCPVPFQPLYFHEMEQHLLYYYTLQETLKSESVAGPIPGFLRPTKYEPSSRAEVVSWIQQMLLTHYSLTDIGQLHTKIRTINQDLYLPATVSGDTNQYDIRRVWYIPYTFLKPTNHAGLAREITTWFILEQYSLGDGSIGRDTSMKSMWDALHCSLTNTNHMLDEEHIANISQVSGYPLQTICRSIVGSEIVVEQKSNTCISFKLDDTLPILDLKGETAITQLDQEEIFKATAKDFDDVGKKDNERAIQKKPANVFNRQEMYAIYQKDIKAFIDTIPFLEKDRQVFQEIVNQLQHVTSIEEREGLFAEELERFLPNALQERIEQIENDDFQTSNKLIIKFFSDKIDDLTKRINACEKAIKRARDLSKALIARNLPPKTGNVFNDEWISSPDFQQEFHERIEKDLRFLERQGAPIDFSDPFADEEDKEAEEEGKEDAVIEEDDQHAYEETYRMFQILRWLFKELHEAEEDIPEKPVTLQVTQSSTFSEREEAFEQQEEEMDIEAKKDDEESESESDEEEEVMEDIQMMIFDPIITSVMPTQETLDTALLSLFDLKLPSEEHRYTMEGKHRVYRLIESFQTICGLYNLRLLYWLAEIYHLAIRYENYHPSGEEKQHMIDMLSNRVGTETRKIITFLEQNDWNGLFNFLGKLPSRLLQAESKPPAEIESIIILIFDYFRKIYFTFPEGDAAPPAEIESEEHQEYFDFLEMMAIADAADDIAAQTLLQRKKCIHQLLAAYIVLSYYDYTIETVPAEHIAYLAKIIECIQKPGVIYPTFGKKRPVEIKLESAKKRRKTDDVKTSDVVKLTSDVGVIESKESGEHSTSQSSSALFPVVPVKDEEETEEEEEEIVPVITYEMIDGDLDAVGLPPAQRNKIRDHEIDYNEYAPPAAMTMLLERIYENNGDDSLLLVHLIPYYLLIPILYDKKYELSIDGNKRVNQLKAWRHAYYDIFLNLLHIISNPNYIRWETQGEFFMIRQADDPSLEVNKLADIAWNTLGTANVFHYLKLIADEVKKEGRTTYFRFDNGFPLAEIRKDIDRFPTFVSLIDEDRNVFRVLSIVLDVHKPSVPSVRLTRGSGGFFGHPAFLFMYHRLELFHRHRTDPGLQTLLLSHVNHLSLNDFHTFTLNTYVPNILLASLDSCNQMDRLLESDSTVIDNLLYAWSGNNSARASPIYLNTQTYSERLTYLARLNRVLSDAPFDADEIVIPLLDQIARNLNRPVLTIKPFSDDGANDIDLHNPEYWPADETILFFRLESLPGTLIICTPKRTARYNISAKPI